MEQPDKVIEPPRNKNSEGSAAAGNETLDQRGAGSRRLTSAGIARRRRQIRMVRFIAAETFAIGVLLVSVIAGVSARFSAESLTPIFRALPIIAGAAAAILPIVFFGDPNRGMR